MQRQQIYKRLEDERGEGVLMATGVLGLTLIFVTLAFHAISFYSARASLESSAKEIAVYAATFLPNAQLACTRAVDAFEVFKMDLARDLEAPSPDLKLKVTIRNASGTDYVFWDPDGTQDCTQTIEPPLASVIVQLSDTYRFEDSRMNVIGLQHWLPLDITAVSTARLSPTDVVLVIDNSNSVVAPLDPIDAEASPVAAFSDWAAYAAGRNNLAPDYSYNAVDLAATSKAVVRMRQCFGREFTSLKSAAVKLFDLLSTSATYRVGVVFTNGAAGEYAAPVVNITSEFYNQAYVPRLIGAIPEAGDDPSADTAATLSVNPGTNSGQSEYEYEESRCAAMASGDYAIPAHPLLTTFDEATAELLDGDATGLIGGGAPDPLAFNPAATLLARQLIWITSAGKSDAYGNLIEKSDFAPLQLAVLRAQDMLMQAPTRTDELPVKKRVVLVLTDGLERPTTDFQLGGDNNLSDPGVTFTRVLAVNGNNDITTQQVTNIDSAEVVNDGDPDRAPILPILCQNSADLGYDPANPNPIYDETAVSTDWDDIAAGANNGGIKLGILALLDKRDWDSTNPLDPSAALHAMPGHGDGLSAAASDDFATYCNTPWSSTRGRFLVHAGDSASYLATIVPKVARALFESEVDQ